MRILTVSDYESPGLWDYFTPEKLDGIDLILSCGDLKPQYLSFLATFAHCPVLYVHGNHDDRYKKDPPLGCICVDGMLYEYQGLRIVGLGGSMRYSYGEHQFTERQMAARARKLAPRLFWKKGFDILLTHAPGRDMVPCNDLAHMGFATFNRLLDKHQPALFVHGHTHLNYGRQIPRESQYGNTRVVNAYERYILELEPTRPAVPEKGKSHK